MLKHRCPWCGEQLPMNFVCLKDPISVAASESNICPKCKKKHKDYSRFSCSFVFIILLLGIENLFSKGYRVYWHEFLISAVCAIILTSILVVVLMRLPYRRWFPKEERLSVEKKQSVKAGMVWTPHKENGLRIPRLQVVNKEIFPACFIDENGTPVSAALCVVLEDLKWTDGHHCTGRIEFVLDDIEEEKLFRKGNQFCLYHNYHCIAKGQIQ